MENQKNELVTIFEKLRAEGRVQTRRDFAELMEVNYTNLSSAMNGDARAYTPKMISRARALLKDSPAPSVEQNGVYIPPETLEFINQLSKTIAQQAEIIDRLTASTGEMKKKAE